MNRDETLRLALKAGIDVAFGAAVDRFAAVIAAAEREACAKVCEAEAEKWEGNDGPICHEARLCAVNIRARGEK